MSVGHSAVIHGCQIQDNVLIGMGAVILDDVIIPSNTIIAAKSLVTSNMNLESGYIYAGIPAKKLRPLDEETTRRYIQGTAEHYIEYAKAYKETS